MKRIAISQRILSFEKGIKRDCLEQDYVHYYNKFDILLISIPNMPEKVNDYLDLLNIEGIILSGGNDIHPRLYNGFIDVKKDYTEERDMTEKNLLDYAINKKLPVLGECRGMQFINVYFGGRITQNIENHVIKKHEITIENNKFINCFKKNIFNVNSYHNNGIYNSDLSNQLESFAKCKDDIIEGIYHKELSILGIMWHPERPGSDKFLNSMLIKLFLNNFRYGK